MKLSKRTRAELARYTADLLARCRRVPCPVCNAPPRAPCRDVLAFYPSRRNRTVKWVHGDRTREAKRAGFVKGRRLDTT